MQKKSHFAELFLFADILYQKKERRQFSVNRQFFEDYIGLDDQPAIKNLVGKRDKILFAQTINRYDRRYKGLKSAKRDLIVNSKGIFLIGREPDKNAPNKSQLVETITRHITMDHLYQVSLSTMQDDFVILHVTNSYDSLLQVIQLICSPIRERTGYCSHYVLKMFLFSTVKSFPEGNMFSTRSSVKMFFHV